MTPPSAPVLPSPAGGRALGPWLWSAPRDLAVFGGSAAVALGLVALRPWLGLPAELPEWGWVVFVLGVDVGHVWSTVLRTYLDGGELRRHPLRYALAPLLAWGAGAGLHAWGGGAAFWRGLAYLALFHFVRQQVGWVAVYRARALAAGLVPPWGARAERALDEAAVYLATLVPVLHWHARLDTARFHWFVPGDFAAPGVDLAPLLPWADAALAATLAAYAARELARFRAAQTLELGKLVVVAATAATWWVGIVVTNSDFDFTVTNVIVHGVPYFALLHAYGRERAREAPASLVARVVARGAPGWIALMLALALLEEGAWDRWVWADRPWLFGEAALLPAAWLPWLVPLLALPQSTHYLLDAFLWRRADTRTRPAQARAVGFGVGPA